MGAPGGILWLVGGFVVGAIVMFTMLCFLWIPGAVLIDKAENKNLDDSLYLAGFVCMMVAACCTLFGACYGACSGVVFGANN